MSLRTMARNLQFLGMAPVRNAISNKAGLTQFQSNGFAQIQSRSYVVHHLSKNINYLTDDKKSVKVNPNTMKLIDPCGKPLCFMLVWLGSTDKNIMKYASIYLDQGYDVLTARITMKDALYPIPQVMHTSGNLLKFMEQNIHTCQPAILSGFSIGTFMWSELMAHISKDVERYEPVVNQFKVQIWDSFVGVDDFNFGVAKAVFPDNPFMRNVVQWYIAYHLKNNADISEIYKKANIRVQHNYCKSPILHLMSKTDQVGTMQANLTINNNWKKMGIPITTKCWDDSPHVQHYHYHPIEYLTELYNFMDQHELLFKPELLRQKIEKQMDKIRAKAKIIPTNV